jgi:hypothetical protein
MLEVNRRGRKPEISYLVLKAPGCIKKIIRWFISTMVKVIEDDPTHYFELSTDKGEETRNLQACNQGPRMYEGNTPMVHFKL